MDDRGRRRERPGQDSVDKEPPLPRVEVDTVRPPGEGGEDAYSAQTVVKAVPKDLLKEFALRPAKVPKFDDAALPADVKEEPASRKAAEKPADGAESAPDSSAVPAASTTTRGADEIDVASAPDDEAAENATSGGWIWLVLAIASGIAAALIWNRCG